MRRRLPMWSPWVVALLGAAAYLLLAPPSADLAAQQYRAELVRSAGLGIWDNGWYGGHHTPAYSLLSPPLGALLGARVAGALAAVAAAALFAPLARRHWGAPGGTAAALWFSGAVIATLLSGRLAFLLGVAFGVAALLALQSGRRVVAAVLAALTTLASPVGGLFLALAVLAWALASTRRRAFAAGAILAAALVPAAALALLFPEGGSEPFVASAFWPALAASVLAAALLPAHERTLRIGAALYALLCAAAFVLATPLGGNATRLGALVAGPILVGALAGRRGSAQSGALAGGRAPTRPGALAGRRGPTRLGELAGRRGPGRLDALAGRRDPGRLDALAGRHGPALLVVLALPLAYWQLYPAVRDVARASGDPSIAASYHAPLVRYLERRPGNFRVEIPFTENHWEARHVAPRVALARGWQRQLDRRYGALFYDGSLDAKRYRAWLDEHAVAYVALPDVPLDYAARAEARLIAGGLEYLRPVWHDAHWRVFAVAHPTPLAEGAAVTLTADGFELASVRRTGTVLVRVRYTRWWTATSGRGDACVERGPGGMTRVRIRARGSLHVQARPLRGSPCRR